MPVHAATIALSAFLLFVVQPIIARQVLPWFGGSASVWTTCMVFFQSALLAGYAYSDALVPRDRPFVATSIWVIVTGNAALLERFALDGIGAEARARSDLRPWTDDHSNLFQVVRSWSGREVL